ncbi:MAG: ABC transporter permease [Armatimonadota bacterium]|nr:ABC transporter permease [Armatimonadota bacterium]MDR7450916.1 ABC transporter permease [Armatimonadota bacterium]MDR7465838.1 ABC transporter permease [Armatimonadota bacterium]MDR7493746.1 ABC transporter permease [Armatimonadota bacterium]MDR7498352.1 ABC transporter permease [Armatimonadota bacterium]
MPSSTPASASEPVRAAVRPASPRYEEVRRAYRLWRRSLLSVVGTVLVGLIMAVALFAPWIAPYDPLAQDFSVRLQPPSRAHWFGTDQFGRDIFSRVVFGSRIALEIILIVSAISGGVGALVGWIAGYFGGRTDEILMRITDMFLAFPSLVLAMAFAAALGPSLPNMILAISLVTWTPYARLARGETLRTKAQDFVEAARAMGASDLRIIFRHVLPMTVSVLIVQLTLRMGTIILTAAGLGFLGLGAQPPTPEWGAMVSDGRNYLVDQWWMSTLPGSAIAAAVLGFNLLGDGIRDILDPRLRR